VKQQKCAFGAFGVRRIRGQSKILHLRHSRESGNPYDRWTPAFAGVAAWLVAAESSLRAKRSSLLRKTLDCFVAALLAITK
jgi:hypothetical protein